MLGLRGAAPVKISTGNTFLEFPENSTKVLPVLVLNLGDISALQYCTGNFLGSESKSPMNQYHRGRPRPSNNYHTIVADIVKN